MAGRPPKPTALKLLQGTLRPNRTNDREPIPPGGIARMPEWLSDDARKWWRSIAPMLRQMNVLTVADTHALALLCDAYAEYLEARQVIRDEGMTYESHGARGGFMIRQRPEVAIAADAFRRLDHMLGQFGMTPGMRSKVIAKPKDDVDPFEEFMSGRGRTSG